MTKPLLWIALVITFCVIEVTGNLASVLQPDKYLYPPPNYLEYFSFGFSESVADSFWLRWIQDSDTCQTYLKPVEYFHPAPVSPGNSTYNPRYKNCDNSWAFKMLDTVTKLAPRFKMPYLAGGISLSVLTEDYVGATQIFERGLAAYPNDWDLAYRAAYHFLFDLHDKKRAAELLLQAKANGAPDWVQLLASRLYSETGQIELGISILENYKAGLKDDESVKVIEKRIAGLRDRARAGR